ncbi:MAG: hypothetical protein GY854_13530 [Deltaproteobacteria bacterium]|nr:hypothetical protein [Deltaproteobacteria bacterium]
MDPLWLCKGDHEAPGWGSLQKDSKDDKVFLVIFDRAGWALIRAPEPPTQYEGLIPTEPPDGMYVSEQGYPIYVVDRQEVADPRELIKALGKEAEEMLDKLGDTTAVIQRLGKAY